MRRPLSVLPTLERAETELLRASCNVELTCIEVRKEIQRSIDAVRAAISAHKNAR